MTTLATDFGSVGRALSELARQCYRNNPWQWRSDDLQHEQKAAFFAWYRNNRAELDELKGLEFTTSESHVRLNRFLENHGFPLLFEPFDGYGAASIMDRLVEWVNAGTSVTITRDRSFGDGPKQYPGFHVKDHLDIYRVAGYIHPLVRLRTKSRDSVWLMKAVRCPQSGIALALEAQKILTASRSRSWDYGDGAIVPKLEIDVHPDVSWLQGLTIKTGLGQTDTLVQAVQVYRLKMNEFGARVSSGSGVATSRNVSAPLIYTIDDPFILFLTKENHDDLALGACWAGTDSWRDSGGTLEDF